MSPPSPLSTSFFISFYILQQQKPRNTSDLKSVHFLKPSRLLKRAVQTPRVEEPTRLERSISVRLERYCVDSTKRA